MSNQDFLARVDAVRREINSLSQQVSSIATAHQRVFSSPDQGASGQLESLTTQTQILNTRIKDEIRTLEIDAKRSPGNATKDTQVKSLKQNFKNQLEQFRKEESEYGQRYRDQIKRQFKIVNPDASEAEVNEAADADWGNEGVFQTAVRFYNCIIGQKKQLR
jgi:syntaxin 1B/2/3